MLFFKRLTLFISSLAFLLTMAGGVLAPVQVTYAQVDGLEEVGDTSGLQDEDLRIVVARMIRTFLSVLGIIAVIIVLYGGFVWMTASGNPDRVDTAKKILINGFIGLAIILLSWSITTFVLNALLNATGSSGGSSSSSSSSGRGTYGGGSTTSFAVAGYSPEGEISIRNVVARITFSRTLDEETVEGNITVIDTETGDEVEGVLEVSSNRVSFTPSQPCPEPNEDRFCFDENTQFTVTVDSDIESSSGTSLDCSASSCTSTFTTGSLVDTADPEVNVTYPESGQSISTDSSSLVQALVTDDSQVSSADFYAADDWIDSVIASGDDLGDVVVESTWYTDDAEEGTRYTLEVTAFDIAGNEDTDSVRVQILPAHCFNGVQDEDEEGRDCGGSCGACDGDSCEEDSDCSGGTCEEGVCVAYPEIESISPSNGAVGTYVTISGSGFGSSGSVYFADGAGGLVEADIPACGDGWTSDEIVAEVPEGAEDGPITIEVSATDYTDATDDDRGALISDFDVNDTQRPSLCDLSPDTQEIGESVTLSGLGFGDSRDDSIITFGTSSISSYSAWSDSSVRTTVPSLTEGEYVDVSITVDGVTSNTLSFGVEYSDDDIPSIYSIDPDSGGEGQYVTLSGTNFGALLGTVWFEDGSTGDLIQASVDFPGECDGNIWSDDQITVIVPEGVTVGSYDVFVTTQADVDSGGIDFVGTDDDPTPGICAIEPDSGDVDDEIIIYGDNFGSAAGTVEFYSSVFASVSDGDWSDDSITIEVPSGASTGPVTVISTAGDESNSVNFEVGATDDDASTSDLPGGYAWYFSTGEIPEVPTLLSECSDDLVSSVPNILYSSEACTNAIVRGTFSTLMAESTVSESNIRVYECGSSSCDVDYEDEAEEYIAATVEATSSATQTSFNWIADSSYNDGKFKTSTWYLVVVTDDLRSGSDSGLGEPMAEDVTWRFLTGADEADCDVEEVMVSPTSATLEAVDEESEFTALPLQQCQVLNPEDYPWDWNLDTYSYIGLSGCDEISGDYCTSTVAVAEGVTTLIGEELDSGTEGSAEVTVNFIDPYVRDYRPDCSTACINGEIGVTFNTEMDGSIINDITLYSCSNELCVGLDEITTTASCSLVDGIGCSEVTLAVSDSEYGSMLAEGEFYRVVVSGSAISNSGVPLTRTNYGDDYSWTFGTRDADGICAVESMSLVPENQVLSAIGETQYYEVSAYSGPDSCSVAGQELTAYDYDWQWQDPYDDEGVAEWVTIAGSLFDIGLTSIPDGCTSSCLATGSEVYYGVCGNGVVEIGEDCDDGNTADGDGCSSSCLSEGTNACTYSCTSTGESCSADSDCRETCVIQDAETGDGLCSITGDACTFDLECTYFEATCDQDEASCCGNSVLDSGEECDDGDAVDGNGCSSSCLNEGARSVDAECGNGDVAYASTVGGEECDDGNAASGDGCSSDCLNEGTVSRTEISAQCGNSILEEPYETCDDGNTTSGDGCSSSCLLETGECDGGEYCSEAGTLLGSSIFYTSPSVCGDGIVGDGELAACEEIGSGSSSDLLIDPLQLAQISMDAGEQVDSDTGIATTTIEAVYSEDLSAFTSLYLSCDAQDDDDCPEGYGLADTGCCMPEPNPTLYPNSSNACLNAEIYGVFSMQMDLESFADNAYVVLDVSSTDDGACPSTHTEVAFGSSSLKWWQKIFRLFTSAVAPIAYAQESGDCVLPITGFTQVSLGDGEYKVTFNHSEALEPNAEYTIHVLGPNDSASGIVTSYGVAMDDDVTQSFETEQSICGLDEVVVLDMDENSPNAFTSTGEEHEFMATAYSYDNGSAQSIVQVAGYAWEWAGWSSDADGIDSEGATTSDELQIISQTSETVGVSDASTAYYEASGLTGEASIAASAFITTDSSGESFTCSYDSSVTGCSVDEDCQDTCDEGVCSISGESCSVAADCPYAAAQCDAWSVVGSTDITAIVCENPWPALSYFPFEDSSDGYYPGTSTSAQFGRGWMNFSTYYCRDTGDEDSVLDDYSDLQVVLAQERGSTEVLKEYFLNVVDDGVATGEAIGIRFAKNESFLSPLAWYYASGFSGTPSETIIDGFPAVVDGRSTYIAVPNYVSGTIYPNIMIISYNYGAATETQEIYQMLVDNLSLAINMDGMAMCYDGANGTGDYCESDLDCDAGICLNIRSKLANDINRLGDVTDLAAELSSTVPQLESGSFIRSLTSSVWGSWTEVLSDELGVEVDTDPLNAYDGCGIGSFSSYDAETCVNESAGEYVCPEGSRVYHYRAYGDSGFVLSAELEFLRGRWFGSIDDDATDDEVIMIGGMGTGDGFENGPAFCDGVTTWGSSDTCGDGVVGASEVCEIGDTGVGASCTTDDGEDGNYITTCQSSCLGYETTDSATCSPLTCGNGVVETGEDCDDGSLNGSYGFCGADCLNSSRTYCGDGELSGGEVCDLGSLNGVYDASADNTCAWDCSGPGPYCGDESVDDSEECDGDTQTYSGKLCSVGSSDDMSCETDSDCGAGGVCGGDACPNTNVCLAGDSSRIGEPCTSNSYCDSSDGDDGICSSTSYQTTRTRSCDGSSCTFTDDWDSIDCIAPGSCGDGIVDDGEECDDGNDDSTDSCTVQCTTNVCGDGYVYSGAEQCDEGTDNGTPCTATYGSTCTYCNASCQSVISSGSFCGDSILNGDEVCDADDISYHYYSTEGGIYGYCDPETDSTISDDEYSYTCTLVGICNGGEDNGDYCGVDSECSENDCALPVCDSSCDSMCPFAYTAQAIAVKTNELDASRTYTVDLSPFSGISSVISTGNSSTMYIPECSVSETLTMSVSDSDREYPDVEIMLVLDQSNSLDSDELSELKSAVLSAVDELYTSYNGEDATMEIGWAFISGRHYESDGSDREFVILPPTDDQDALESSINSDLVGGDQNGTPILYSIQDAQDAFSGNADVEYMIIFTDGNIQNHDYDELTQEDLVEYEDSGVEGAILIETQVCDDGTIIPADEDCEEMEEDEEEESPWIFCSCGVAIPSDMSCAEVCEFADSTPIIYKQIEDSSLVKGLSEVWSSVRLWFAPSVIAADEITEEEYIQSVSAQIDTMKSLGIEVYSATLTTNSCDTVQMQRWSNMECDADETGTCSDQRAEGNYECSVPDNGITYAYSATSASGLTGIYESIADSILNVTISLTFGGETISTTIAEGASQAIELPTTFSCDGSGEQEVTMRTTFNGDGTIELSNINLNMCSQ